MGRGLAGESAGWEGLPKRLPHNGGAAKVMC